MLSFRKWLTAFPDATNTNVLIFSYNIIKQRNTAPGSKNSIRVKGLFMSKQITV